MTKTLCRSFKFYIYFNKTRENLFIFHSRYNNCRSSVTLCLPPLMATMTRIFKPQFSSIFKRSLSTTEDVNKVRCFQWVFLGCPGVGKGTYASKLSSLLGVPHIATGDLVRHELSSSGPLSSQVYNDLLLI